jgi:hypothetical protein
MVFLAAVAGSFLFNIYQCENRERNLSSKKEFYFLKTGVLFDWITRAKL